MDLMAHTHTHMYVYAYIYIFPLSDDGFNDTHTHICIYMDLMSSDKALQQGVCERE